MQFDNRASVAKYGYIFNYYCILTLYFVIIGGFWVCAMVIFGINFVNVDEMTSPPARVWISNIFSKTRDFYIIINARLQAGRAVRLYF